MSKEIIQRTDIYKGEFSPSSISTAVCLRRFYLEKVLRLQAKGNFIPLNFGTAIHAGVELFYKMRKQDILFEQLKMACVKEFADTWSGFGVCGDNKRNLDTGILTIAGYCDTYKHDSSDFDIADIECTQWLPMENGTKLLVKLDRVLIGEHLIRLVDTKTTSSALTEFFFKKFENDMQTTLYMIVVLTLMGRCNDIQIDAIKVPPNTATQHAETFVRRCFMRTDLQIEDCVNTYTQMTNYIMSVLTEKKKEEWPTYFYCNMSECDKYGGCKYLPICTHGLQHPAVSLDFVTEGTEVEKDEDVTPITLKSGGRIVC